MKEFNVNDEVMIKLNEIGIAILKKEHDDLLKCFADQPTALESLGEFQIPIVDENGYTKMPLWQVMNTFGKHLNVGIDLPFSTTIAISDENLKDPETVKNIR